LSCARRKGRATWAGLSNVTLNAILDDIAAGPTRIGFRRYACQIVNPNMS
jgi:hypothetical protein